MSVKGKKNDEWVAATYTNFGDQSRKETLRRHFTMKAAYKEVVSQLRTAFPAPVSDRMHDAYFVFSFLRALDQLDALKSAAPMLGSPVTLDYVRWAAQHVTIPWFAIGGITLENLDDILAAGASRRAGKTCFSRTCAGTRSTSTWPSAARLWDRRTSPPFFQAAYVSASPNWSPTPR